MLKEKMEGEKHMYIIAGLGNPTMQYEGTRHNAGFDVIDALADKYNISVDGRKNRAYIGKGIIEGQKVLLVKPQTYMNLSGESIGGRVDYFKIDMADILVVSDDLDLKVGNFKLKANGSCGGHNGLRDIENKLGSSNYKRLKIGISKNSNVDTKDYVLGSFSSEEKTIFVSLYKELFNVLDDYFELPFGDLMSKYNRKNR